MDKDVIILSEKKEGYTGKCSCCDNINFVYKNIAIKFTPDEFDMFSTYLNTLNTEDFILENINGRNVFMRSPVKNIVFCFSKAEIEEIRELLNETALLLDVYRILKR